MIPPKAYYSTYLAGDEISELNKTVVDLILKENPNHVFEMGCGTGKNLKLIQKLQVAYARDNICVSGLDVSLINVIHSHVKNGIQHIAIGDESYLRHYVNYDVCFTVSVLDHIEEVDAIIQELQRIANKCVILAEAVEADHSKYYYAHDYEKFGFEKLDYKFKSDDDGFTYLIWRWYKQNEAKKIYQATDDLAH